MKKSCVAIMFERDSAYTQPFRCDVVCLSLLLVNGLNHVM